MFQGYYGYDILMEDRTVIELELSSLLGHEPDKTSFQGNHIFSVFLFSIGFRYSACLENHNRDP